MGDDKAQSSETATDTFLWLRQVAQDFMNLDPVACSIAVNQSHYFSGGRLEFFLVKDKAAAELKVHPKTIQRGIRSLVENGHMIEFGRHKRNVVYHATMKEPATESPVVGQRVSNYGGGVVGQRMSNYRSDRAAPTARSRTHAVQGSLDRSSPYLDTRCPRDSLENLPGSDSTEAPPPPSPPAVEAQRAADEERKRIDLTATPRDEGLARALAGFAACKPSGRTIAADEVAAVITDKPIPTAAIDVTPREAPMLTPVAAEWDACLQLVAEWGGINLDRAVETVTAMVAKLPIERVQHHFSKVSKLHPSAPNKLELI